MALLALCVTVDLILNTIGYGMLYLRHIMPLIEAIFVLINASIVLGMFIRTNDSKGLFGVKMLCAVILLILRLETLKEKVMRLCRSEVKKIHPEGQFSTLHGEGSISTKD